MPAPITVKPYKESGAAQAAVGMVIGTTGPVGTIRPEPGLEWCPLASPSRLPFNGTDYQSVRKALIGMWGKFPIRLSRKNADDLAMKAMMIVAGDGNEPYRILLDALATYGEIEVRDV